jgi:hypothetical protein
MGTDLVGALPHGQRPLRGPRGAAMRSANVLSASVMWVRLSAAALISTCLSAPSQAGGFSDWVSLINVPEASLSNSIFVFAGRMSTTTFGDTLAYNSLPISGPFGQPSYDNYIVGSAYQKDFFRYGGLVIAGEIGIADRLGNYAECCSPIVTSSTTLNSGELWFGPAFRYDGVVLLNQLRIVPGMTFGFSVTTNSIGVEREREITNPGNARFLGYLGPEVAFSTLAMPQLEFVVAVHHRSGADHTFGNFGEGYNANVAGLRYCF